MSFDSDYDIYKLAEAPAAADQRPRPEKRVDFDSKPKVRWRRRGLRRGALEAMGIDPSTAVTSVPRELRARHAANMERLAQNERLQAGATRESLGIRVTPKKIKLRADKTRPISLKDIFKSRYGVRTVRDRAMAQMRLIDLAQGEPRPSLRLADLDLPTPTQTREVVKEVAGGGAPTPTPKPTPTPTPTPTPMQTREVVKDVAGGGGSTRAGGAAAGGTSNFGRNALIGAGLLGLGAGAYYLHNRNRRRR